MTRAARPNEPQKRASDPAQSAWVNANAGSGKTRVLVDRVIRLMLAGTPPSRILCLTFTKAAATEMASRVFNMLAEWIGLDDERLEEQLEGIGCREIEDTLVLRARQLFAATQETPGGLKIQTIHAFCERLLQLFPVEAGMAPGFSVLDDASAAEIRTTCRDAVITEAVTSPDTELGKALSTVTAAVSQETFDELLAHMLSAASAWYAPLDPVSGIDAITQANATHLGLTHEELVGDFGEMLQVDLGQYRQLAALLVAGKDSDQKAANRLAPLLSSPAPSLRDAEDFLLTSAGEPRKTGTFPTKIIRDSHPWAVAFIESEQRRLVAALEKLGDVSGVLSTRSLLLVAAAILQRYEQEKRQRGQYDFGDLIDRTNALLAEKPDAAWVLYKLDGGIDHVLIDEAQDTSPSQWEIVRSLTAEFFAGAGSRPDLDRTIFAVGDRKQSIFSFQGADPLAFEQARVHFAERIRGAGKQLIDVDFTLTFRSAPEILKVVDKVFEQGTTAHCGVGSPASTEIQHHSQRDKARGLVEVWPLEEPDGKQQPEPWTAPVDRVPASAPPRKLARLIAETIKSWIGQRHIGNSDRIVSPGDILILVRRRNLLFDAMISELRRNGIPVAGADRLKLMESIAVLDLLALGSFVLMPEDDYSLACVLKSPLVSIPVTEAELFELCNPRGPASLWQRLRSSDVAAHRIVAAEISRWLAEATAAPPFEFFAAVIETRRRAIISRLGSEANDPLNAFLQAALDHGRDHVPSLAAFLAWFKSGDIEIRRNMEQARGEVRVMTVHGAKGLEAPIVILPDTAAVPEARGRAREQILDVPVGNSGRKIPLWAVPKARDSEKLRALKILTGLASLEEFHRLLYVAMTRARDELYVCGYRGVKQPPAGNWHELVMQQLQTMAGVVQTADGRLRYGVEPSVAKDVESSQQFAAELPRWIEQPIAATPVTRPSAVTGLAREQGETGVLDQDAIAHGNTLHRLLQLLPDVPESERFELARHVVRRAGQPDSFAEEALSLFTHEALAPLLRGDALAEVSLSAPLPRLGTTVNGRIDRLVIEEGSVSIIDYKTDRKWPRDLSEVPASYARQMALYREVMRGAYAGRDIRCILVWTSGPIVMELPSSVLDQALERLAPARA